MPQITSAPEFQPLPDYEPSVAITDAIGEPTRDTETAGRTVAIPAQRRPDGQLSLRLWTAEDTGELPAPLDRRKLAAVLTAIVEVRGGSRAPRQIRTMLHPSVYHEMLHRSGTPAGPYTLRSIHTRQPLEGVIEACGRVHGHGRALAMCARFDEDEHGWLCTEFTIIGPTSHR